MRIENPVNMIITRKGNVLLVRRSKDSLHHAGKWSLPGGGTEFGESYEVALRREIKEELDCEIATLRFFRSYFVKVLPGFYARAVLFSGTIKGQVRLNRENDAFRWFTLENAKGMKLAFNQMNIIRDFCNR
jgi:8-oxo-dGTP diphosphatase